ncbi:MAG: hypothetical protein PHW82_09690, partial [Bacteroidales bacterium]|nr:hypothetical protein [Bacteroidales bacterium]
FFIKRIPNRLTVMKKQFLYLLILAAVIVSLTSSCTPQKRLNRLVALHPELVQTDTIRIRDTTIIPETRIDTSFNQDRLKDTVIITKEKLTVKIHQVLDTVYVEAEREADTVVVVKEVAVERVVTWTPERGQNQAAPLFDLQSLLPIMIIIVGILFFVLIWRRFPR